MSSRNCLLCSTALILSIPTSRAADAQAVATTTTAAQAATPAPTNEGLAEIVVTAQKRSENVQRIPIAITAVSPVQLATGGVETVLDLGNVVPGLKLLDIGGQVSPRIRGIGSTSIAPGQESPVAVVVDGVYYASSSDVAADLADVAQVSVLKGPQGTLFGRNATGGVVQISTRDPSQQFHVDLATGIDNYATSRSSAYVGGPVGNNVRAGLAVQYVTQGRGWGKNIFNGQDVHKIDNDLSLRGKVIFEPSAATTIKLSGDYAYRNGSVAGVYTVFPGFVQSYSSPIPPRKWDIDSYIQPRNSYSGGGGSLSIEQDLGFARLTSISAYRTSKQFWQFNPTASAVPSLDLAINDFSRQFTEEVQLVSPSGRRLTYAIGAFYIDNVAGQDPIIINFRGVQQGLTGLTTIKTRTSQKLDSVAGFAQATYKITQSTRFTAGFRYTYEKKVLTTFEDGATLANPPGVSFQFGTKTPQSQTASKPTWRFAIDQDLSPKVIGYISYNRGFKSGGFNVRDGSNPPFLPEQIDAYETGIKSQLFDNRLRLNLGAFYYDYKNVQVARYVNTTIIYNGGRARIYGLDMDLDAKLTDRIQLTGGMSYLHSRFTDFPNAASSFFVPRPQPSPLGPGYDITLTRISAKGKTLPYSPDFTYNVSLSYRLPTAIGPVIFNASDSYSSKFYAESDNVLTQQSYHFVNVSTAWQSSDERYGVRLFVNNIFDKAVSSQFGTLPTGYEADYPSPPRTFGIKLTASY